MTESRISSALRGRLQQLQNTTLGRLGRSAQRKTPAANTHSHATENRQGSAPASHDAVKPFPVPFAAWPSEIMGMILPHAVERDSGFAVASRRARGLHLESAIGVVREAIKSGGCSGDEVGKVRNAYHFLRKVVFSVVAAGPAEQAASHAGPESTVLSAAVGLMADSARRSLNGCAVAWDARAAREADWAIKTFLSYVRIEAGTFLMGSSEDTDPHRFEDEVQHYVQLTEPFMLKQTSVTEEEWFEVMGTHPPQSNGPNGEYTGKYPKVNVSWYDAVAYCEALTRRLGYTIDLPSEAQWECAARAGTEGPTYAAALGKSLDDIAWTYENSGGRIHPVGLKLPNAWGLDGMIGNNGDWIRDKYGDYPKTGRDNPAVDPQGASRENAGVNRVFRGGSWRNDGRYARAAFRGNARPAYRSAYLGLRPARSVVG